MQRMLAAAVGVPKVCPAAHRPIMSDVFLICTSADRLSEGRQTRLLRSGHDAKGLSCGVHAHRRCLPASHLQPTVCSTAITHLILASTAHVGRFIWNRSGQRGRPFVGRPPLFWSKQSNKLQATEYPILDRSVLTRFLRSCPAGVHITWLKMSCKKVVEFM